jgi:hypothetical protein
MDIEQVPIRTTQMALSGNSSSTPGGQCAQQANRRIAILLPSEWRGGMLRNAWALASLLVSETWPRIGDLEVVVGLRSHGPYDWPALEREYQALGRASVRRMDWQSWPVASLRTVFGPLPEIPGAITECSFPRDYGQDFLDCDAWIVFGRLEGFVLPVRPVAVYCADQIERYVPEVISSSDEERMRKLQLYTQLGWRQACCVFSTTPHTVTDAVSYAGVRQERALLVPTLVDPICDPPPVAEAGDTEPYILWITNASAHKNHQVAVDALKIYYTELGGDLSVVIAGPQTNLFLPGSGADYPACLIVRAAAETMPHLRVAGEVSNAAYLRLVSKATVVWHNVIVDNGTFVAFDAARADRHFVSSDYPQMRYLCGRYGVDAMWYPSLDPRAAALALLEAGRRVNAKIRPQHELRSDAPEVRRTAYGTLLDTLFAKVHD